MLPSDEPDCGPWEGAEVGCSGLPFTTTPELENAGIRMIVKDLLAFIHKEKCEATRRAMLEEHLARQAKGYILRDGWPEYECPKGICQFMKDYHVTNCESQHCPIPHCNLVGKLYEHWRLCNDDDCCLCTPVLTIMFRDFTALIDDKVYVGHCVGELKSRPTSVLKETLRASV